MSYSGYETSFPVPMLPGQFVEDFIEHVSDTQPGDTIGLATMQLAAQMEREESVVYRVLGAMLEAKRRDVDAKVIVDEHYVHTMTRIGNRDLPNWVPILRSKTRAEQMKIRSRTDGLLEELDEAGLLMHRSPVRVERGYVPLLRHASSLHIAQKLYAVVHTKAAFVVRTDGDVVSWLNTGNFTDSDIKSPHEGDAIGMNNLSMRLSGKAASFVVKAVTGVLDTSAGTNTYGDQVKLIHDIGNSGEPARLPSILTEALAAIDPRRVVEIRDPDDPKPRQPKAIVLLSQYAPNGLLLNALEHVADNGAYVHVPLQPTSDHRSKSFPYNVNNALFRATDLGKTSIRREVSSHVKAQIVTYYDGTAQLIIGTDNFVTNLQKLVRNEEIAVSINLDCKNPLEAEYFNEIVAMLRSMGELTHAVAKKLLED